MDWRTSVAVTLTLAAVLMQIPLAISHWATPPSKMDRPERSLTSDQIAKSPCTDLARSFAGKLPGTLMDSETASLSDEFGHVYRYDMVNPIEFRGVTHRVHTILVVWSKDCEAVMIATYPTYELPSPR